MKKLLAYNTIVLDDINSLNSKLDNATAIVNYWIKGYNKIRESKLENPNIINKAMQPMEFLSLKASNTIPELSLVESE